MRVLQALVWGSSKVVKFSRSRWRLGLALAGLVGGLVGCSTQSQKSQAQNKETLLQASGFRAIVATTPAEQQMLKTLPAGRVSAVQRDGQVYFVYPMRERNMLYLGRNSHFLEYEGFAQSSRQQDLIRETMQEIDRFPSSPVWSAPPANWDAE